MAGAPVGGEKISLILWKVGLAMCALNFSCAVATGGRIGGVVRSRKATPSVGVSVGALFGIETESVSIRARIRGDVFKEGTSVAGGLEFGQIPLTFSTDKNLGWRRHIGWRSYLQIGTVVDVDGAAVIVGGAAVFGIPIRAGNTFFAAVLSAESDVGHGFAPAALLEIEVVHMTFMDE